MQRYPAQGQGGSAGHKSSFDERHPQQVGPEALPVSPAGESSTLTIDQFRTQVKALWPKNVKYRQEKGKRELVGSAYPCEVGMTGKFLAEPFDLLGV